MVLPHPHLFLKIYLSIIIKITAIFILLFFSKMAASAGLRTTTSRYRYSSAGPSGPRCMKKQQVSEFCPIFPEQNWALAHNKQCARYKTYIVLASRCPGGTYATITLYEQHLLHTQCLKTLIFLSC